MMRFRPERPSPTLVMSVIPLIIALDGTGYAAIRLATSARSANTASSTNAVNLARRAGL